MYDSLCHRWISLHTTSPFNPGFISDYSLLQSHRPYHFNLFASFLVFYLSITFADSGLGSETDSFVFLFNSYTLQLRLLKQR